jgi:hypothetical protein
MLGFLMAGVSLLSSKNKWLSTKTQSIKGPFPVVFSRGSLRFEKVPQGAQVTLSHQFHLPILLKPLELWLTQQGKKKVNKL